MQSIEMRLLLTGEGVSTRI